jgi:hypothetical protein
MASSNYLGVIMSNGSSLDSLFFQLQERVADLDKKVNDVNIHFDRIEEKVNYIINLLEVLISDEDEDEEEDEEELDDSNEGWIVGLDSWKEVADDDDE